MLKRIVADIHADNPEKAKAFYRDILGLDVLMDQGWVITMGSEKLMPIQITFASNGGSGAPMPDLSIEVDDFEVTLAKIRESGIDIEYGPVVEPWGVKRFFVRDPFGKLLNILVHV